MVQYPSVLSYTVMLDVERWKHGHIGDVAILSVVVYYNRSYPHIADCSSTISLMTASHPCTIYLSYKYNMTDILADVMSPFQPYNYNSGQLQNSKGGTT